MNRGGENWQVQSCCQGIDQMTNHAKIVTIEVSQGDAGLLHATSPEVKELFVSGETIAEVTEAVPVVLTAIYAAHGVRVTVVEAEANDLDLPAPWVVLSGPAFAQAV